LRVYTKFSLEPEIQAPKSWHGNELGWIERVKVKTCWRLADLLAELPHVDGEIQGHSISGIGRKKFGSVDD
jgi:hypothetical protein